MRLFKPFQALALRFGEATLFDMLDILKISEDTRIPTMAVSQNNRLYYNPQWIKQLSEPELLATLLHEMLHIAFEHTKPVDVKTDKDLLNIAQDIIINELLRDLQYSLPKCGYFRETFGVPAHLKIHRDIYNWLLENIPPKEKLKIKLNFDQLMDLLDKLDAEKDQEDTGQNKIDVVLNTRLTKEQSEKLREKLGKLASGLLDSCETRRVVCQPATPFAWHKKLQSEIGRLISPEILYTFTKIPRHKMSGNILRKGLDHGTTIPKINIYVDTSGSMQNKIGFVITKLKQIKSSLKRYKPTYYGFNTETYLLDLEYPSCGGGTAFTAFRDGADLQIIITDGEMDLNFLNSYTGRLLVISDRPLSLRNHAVLVDSFTS
jgi:predicted metal-dependent peptidase